MEEFFSKAVVDNPLNIKTVNGNIPTTKESGKNIFLLVGVGAGLALTFSTVYGSVMAFTGSLILTILILLPVYGLIIFKTLSVSIFEEKRHKVAYKDMLENKMSDLSVLWEVQDVKIKTSNGEQSIGYIDYISGARSIILKCVFGCVLNKEDKLPIKHYNSITRALKTISELDLSYDIYVRDEVIEDNEAFNFYYSKLKEYDDPYFVSIFTEMLDFDRQLASIKSAVPVIYIKINGKGSSKHKVLKNAFTILESLGSDNAFKEMRYLQDEHEIDLWIAKEHSVSLYDREALVMNKFKDFSELGLTTVVLGLNEDGTINKKFNSEYDARRVIKKKSIELNREVKPTKEEYIEEKVDLKSEAKSAIESQDEGIDISLIDEIENQQVIKLVYSDEKVTLGG